MPKLAPKPIHKTARTIWTWWPGFQKHLPTAVHAEDCPVCHPKGEG